MTGTRRLPGLLFALLTLLLVQAVQAREMVSVARAEINMRSGPGTGHDVTWMLTRGYPLQVLGRKGQWLRVRDFESDEGWVFRSLTGKVPHYVVKAKVANLRSAPSMRGRIVGKAGYGEVLRTLAHRDGWARVRNEDGLVGWVARRLLWGW
ncbi:MAG TPA: SH3 domain-containing protein [Burkholderiaceae bacterium]|jgi:SH3-like domain-containing protein|nr:SH3 domain-containing protein [Burkholderiaceae bacterium]